jgi:hypothetical protein
MKPLFVFVFSLFFLVSYCQENYEIQVYGSPTMTKGQTMFELHSNYTSKGNTDLINGIIPSNHSVHETIEITHGFDR